MRRFAVLLMAAVTSCSSNAGNGVGDEPDSAAGGDGGTATGGGAATGGSTANGGNSNAGGSTGTGAMGTGGATGGGGGTATPGWNVVAIDTPLRTYLGYVDVPASGVWTPEADGWPILAQWEKQTTRTAMRFQSFRPGDTLTPQEIIALLPAVRIASHTIDITAAPYNAQVAPADATAAINAALKSAGVIATRAAPVDVLVPPGTFNYSKTLVVPHDVRLRRWPEDSGGTLVATNANDEAIHLTGDRSGALFLVIKSPSSTTRLSAPWESSIWVGAGDHVIQSVTDTLVVGNDVSQSASAHVIGLSEHGGLWAFNYAHDGYADTFHHTGGSSDCQVVGNRAQESATRGDDFYAFVGYIANGDPVHHCVCVANWGRNGPARGLSAVGASFISFEHNDIAHTQAAGVYLAQEDGYATYGTFDVRVLGNTIAQANLNASHDGLLAYSDSPSNSDPSTTFGTIPHRIERLTIQGNEISDTAPGFGNGYGIEIRPSVDTGDVSGNTLTHNRAPQIVVNGTNFTQSNNTILP